jgi:hypothetical protein
MEPYLWAITALLPALILLLGFFLWQRKNEKLTVLGWQADMRKHQRDLLIPIRLQAHERCVLFLERISPQHLISRVDSSQKTVRQLQVQLISEIKAEYEHNLTQQLYVSEEAWAQLIRAKEETLAVIHRCAGKISPESGGVVLGKMIIEAWQQWENPPIALALKTFRKEIKSLF